MKTHVKNAVAVYEYAMKMNIRDQPKFSLLFTCLVRRPGGALVVAVIIIVKL
jgi:hypothetical protein